MTPEMQRFVDILCYYEEGEWEIRHAIERRTVYWDVFVRIVGAS